MKKEQIERNLTHLTILLSVAIGAVTQEPKLAFVPLLYMTGHKGFEMVESHLRGFTRAKSIALNSRMTKTE